MQVNFGRNCSSYQKMFSDYLNKTLKKEETEKLERHLFTCKRCFKRYVDFVENWVKTQERGLYLAGRPRWGMPSWTLDKEKELVERICTRAIEMEKKNKKGVILLKYEPGQQRAVLMLQLRIATNLRELGKDVLLITPENKNFLLDEKIDDEKVYLVIAGATKFPDFREFKMKYGSDKILIVSGLSNEWTEDEIFSSDLVYTLHPEPEVEDYFRPFVIRGIEESERKISSDEELKKVYFYVSILDHLGISTPLTLLSKLIKKGQKEILQLIEGPGRVIHKVDTPGPVMLVTKGEAATESMIKKLKEEEVNRGYQRIVEVADLDILEERYTVMKLLQMLVKKGKAFTVLKKFVMPFEKKIDRIWTKEDIRGMLAWGKIFDELRLFEKSEAVFLGGLKKERENVYLLNCYARMLGRWARRRPDRYSDAKERFSFALSIEPGNIHLWHSRGKMEEEMGYLKEAYDCFQEALRIDETNLYTLVSLANIELKRGRIDEAEKWLNKAVRIASENIYTLHVFGQLEMARLNYEKAEEYFNKVLKIDPENIPALHALGVMCKNRRHWKKAEKFLNKAFEIHPESEYVLQTLGELLGEEEQYDKAVKKFRKVIEFDPEHIEALIAWGQLEARREDHQRAEELFSKAKNINPDNIRLYGAWAEAKLKEGDLDNTEKLLDIAMDKPGNKVPIWNLYGKLNAYREKMETARRFFNRAYEKSHGLDKIITLNSWTEMEMKHGDLKRAEYLAKKSFDMDKDNGYTCRVYAKCLEEMKKYKEAEKYRKKAEELEDADIKI